MGSKYLYLYILAGVLGLYALYIASAVGICVMHRDVPCDLSRIPEALAALLAAVVAMGNKAPPPADDQGYDEGDYGQ